MSAFFEKGREAFADAAIDWNTDTVKFMLANLAVADVGVKAITGATNATPIVITATSHGFANGDLVYINGVGGNLAANGIWIIANQAANTFELQRPDAVNAAGSAAYTSGGYAVNLTLSDFLDDVSACRVGTDQTLTTPTIALGVLDGVDPVYTAVAGGVNVHAAIGYKDTGSEATSRLAVLQTGWHIVTCAATAASSATSVAVEALVSGIANSTVLTFSNGASATLTATGNVGDRTLTVSSLAAGISAGSRALAPAPSSNFPLPTNGGNITLQFNNGATRIGKL